MAKRARGFKPVAQSAFFYDNARFQHHGYVSQGFGAGEGVVLHGNDIGHSARYDGAYVVGKAHMVSGDRSC